MADDIEFIDGLIVKPPHERAPEFVKCKLSFKREALIAWLQSKDGEWVNAYVKVSNGGKWYAAVDNWKPNGERQATPARQAPAAQDDFADSETIPF